MSGETITECIVAFWDRPSPRTLTAAVAIIIRQGRVIEVLYSLVVQLLHRPGQLVPVYEAGHILPLATKRLAATEKAALADYLADFPRVARWLGGVTLRLHTVANVGHYTIAGEYGETDPRLFLLDDTGCKVSTHYRGIKGVRHIHCIHPLSQERFMVTTGDSLRVADLWRIDAGELRFERRILRFLGGFTAGATAGGRTYFGSDYSSRPNYLWRFEDKKRFYLPAESFRMLVDRMDVVDNRFILVICKTLEAAGGGWQAVIFDTSVERFIAPLG
jgi:hypothetical protein